jgi:hypothetical protein
VSAPTAGGATRAIRPTLVRHTLESLPPTLHRPLRSVRRRIRLQRAADGAGYLTFAALGLAAVVLSLAKTGWLPPTWGAPFLLVAVALPLVGALLNGLRRVPLLLAAQLLDRAHGLRSRVATALELSAVPEGGRSAFQRAAIMDAAGHASTLAPSRAFPLRRPAHSGAMAVLGAGVAALAVMHPPPSVPPATAPDGLAALLLHEDDLEAFESELDELLMEERDTTPEMHAAAQKYNQLLEDLADRRIDQSEALRRIAALERHLMAGQVPDRDALDRALRDMGQRMRSEPTQDASKALRDADASRADREMRKLAEQLRTEKMSRDDVEQLRKDLERASKSRRDLEEQRREIEQRRDETERLLQKQRENEEQDTPEQERLLKKRQRELERLRREHQQMREQQRQLERLQREIEQAAEDLNDGRSGDAADAMDRGAEDLNRMAREKMGEDQMRQLAEQLKQLRELIRRQRQEQQGQGGQSQAGQGQGRERMQRFVMRARGDGDAPLLMPGQEGSQGQQGRGGQGGDGDGEGDGKGQGEGQGEGQRALMLGGDGEGEGQRAILELPGMGAKQPGGEGSPERGRGGAGPGTGGDPGQRGEGDGDRLDAQHEHSRVAGEQAGDGPTRSEVILGAADRGFVTRGYQKVHADYRDHAEEILEQDEVPPGYRFYVRRYFQLIRPREAP